MRIQPKFVVRITPEDVGERVTIRARRPDAVPGEPSHTDVVGHLRDWSEGVLTLERRDGTVTEVREADLVAARVVQPPNPPGSARRGPDER